MIFSGRAFGKIDVLQHGPFVQYWNDAGITPPPPGTDVRITNDGENRITNSGDVRVTNTGS